MNNQIQKPKLSAQQVADILFEYPDADLSAFDTSGIDVEAVAVEQTANALSALARRMGEAEKEQSKRKRIWRNETDWWSAESRDEARRKYMQFYGYVGDGLDMKVDESILEAVDSFEEEPLPDDKVLGVVFQEGFQCTDEAGVSHDIDYPPWVDRVIAAGERNVKVEKVKLGSRQVYRVTAPALIWATYMDGMVCSTEF